MKKLDSGLLICIEGTDGSGKGTQTKKLLKSLNILLKDTGRQAVRIEFPQYTNSFFGKMVGEFLDGQYGELDNIHPKIASVLYANDRQEAKGLMHQHLNDGDIVLCDRYVGSNMAYQASRLPEQERAELRDWLYELEHTVLGIPVPDMTIFLDVPVEVSKQLVLLKAKRDYTDKAEDIMEAKHDLLRKVYGEYKKLAEMYNWHILECMRYPKITSLDSLKEPEAIASELFDVVKSACGILNLKV